MLWTRGGLCNFESFSLHLCVKGWLRVVIVALPGIFIWAATWQNQQSDCAPSEDSDQPGHPPRLIRVFAVRMKSAWVLSYPLSAHRRCPGWSESSLSAQSLCRFCHVAVHLTFFLFSSKLYRRHYHSFLTSMSAWKYTLLEQGLSELEFSDDVVNNFKKMLGRNDFTGI